MSDAKQGKRGWDDAGGSTEEQSPAKKPKTETPNNGGAAATNGSGPPKPAVSLDVLEKAKKALQLQKQLQEKLKKLPAVPRPSASPAAAAPSGPTKRPTIKPLLLDDQGREIDEHGNLVQRKPQQRTTLKVNQQADRSKASVVGDLGAGPSDEAGPSFTADFFDPSMGNRELNRLQRRPRASFDFVQEGRLQKQAENARLRAKFGDRMFRRPPRAPVALGDVDTTDVNAIPLGQRATSPSKQAAETPIPDIEWWDARITQHETYDDVTGDNEQAPLIREERITALVEHPVLIEPPAEAPAPEPQPLKLTRKEIKKIRTQRRLQREQDKMLLIHQGLLEPPKPKVKISNLMRVLTAEATADPTAIEKEVRRQMDERQQAHEDRNLARKLTPAERREKKIRKMFDEDATGAVHVAVYRVDDLSYPQNRFKVDVNATENRFSGTCIITPTLSVVVVEGCPKSHKRYEKLMLRRIDWSLAPDDAPPREQPNQCHLVWKGVVLKKAFYRFRVEQAPDEESGKRLLGNAGVGHYWDLAKNYVPAS